MASNFVVTLKVVLQSYLINCYINTPSLKVDDMDNHKSHLPQSPVIGKTSGSLFRLPTKVTQNRKVVFYVNNNQYEQSGSKLVSILYRLLQKVIEDFGSLPKHLGINLDNCWRFLKTSSVEMH